MKKYIFLFMILALSINVGATQIGTKQIKDQAITTAKLDDEAVNDTKLEAVLKAKIPTADEKAAMTGANSPSAANVLATMDDITGLDSGVQTVTDGDFITNSGTAKNPILDVDVDDSSEANTQLWTAEKITSELAGKVDQADSALIQHNDLLGKQGGTVDEYYHMTNAQHTRIDELESTDTPVFASVNIGGNYQFPPDIGTSAQILKVPAAGTVLEWGSGGAGYTNLTEFVDQTAWRFFYSNADGDVIESVLGAAGTFWESNGADTDPVWSVPAGGGDVVGPAGATDNNIAVFDTATGKLIQDSGTLISDLLDKADSVVISDVAYDDTTWDSNTDGASKNTIRDKVNTMDTAIGLNTAKVTNATHTGEVTGSVGLVLDPTCISGKSDTTIADSDYVLFWDDSDSTLKKVDAAELTAGGGGGYTNLTQFVDQTAWRFFYSNTDGDVIEFPLGIAGTFMESNGADTTPVWSVPAGGGDVVGPAGATDNNIATFDTATGKLIQDSGTLISDLLAVADSPVISDIAYDDTTWDSNTDGASKNAIRDKINPMDTAIGLNTAKTTNQTHTGEVTGSVGLVLDPTCISGKADTTVVDADYFLFWDATDSTLKKVDAAELTAAVGGGAKWRFVNLPAGSWDYPTANPAPLDTDTGTNGTIKRQLFDDTTEEFVIVVVQMPSDLDVADTVFFEAYGYAETAVADSYIELTVYHSAKTDGESWDAAYSSKISGDLTTDGSQDYLDYFSWSETVSTLGWAVNDQIRIKLSRSAPSANNLSGDWGLTHFRIKLPRE